MQKLLIPAVILVLGLSSCDNDLNLTALWKDIPVVYGIISPTDTAHYIRIEKAFLDPSRSAFEIARNPDSLYYTDLTAALINTSTGQRFALTAVDGADEGYPRQDGVFASSPNILYKVSAATVGLTPGITYRLEIDRSERLPKVTAVTSIVGRPTINRPQNTDALRFQYHNSYQVLWVQASGAAFYDVHLTFRYNEFPVSNPSEVSPKSAVWKASGVVTQNEFNIPGIEFYKFLEVNLEANPALRRTFTGIDIQVRAGGPELREFQRVQLANTGITSAGGDVPQYTNLSEGVGIFTSSNKHERVNLQLHTESLDSLINGVFTKPLNFQ